MKIQIILLFFQLINTIKNTVDEFKCDNGEKILPQSKINDNFCDCKDGTDETLTNACENGLFTCRNLFNLKKIIPNSWIDDGVCDCCDGSDELKRNNCPNTCLQQTINQFENDRQLIEKLAAVVNSYDKNDYTNYFISQINQLNEINYFFEELKEVYTQKHLLLSYIERIRNEIGEEEFQRNDFYVDENEIVLFDLRKSLDHISEKIRIKEKLLSEKYTVINNFLKYSVFQEMEDSCFDSHYKSYDVKLCLFKTIEYRGFKDSRYKTKNIGTFERYENNVFYYRNGVKCGVYNKFTSGKMSLECGEENQLIFLKKEGCEYEFIYKTKLGCNIFSLKNMTDRINQYFSEHN